MFDAAEQVQHPTSRGVCATRLGLPRKELRVAWLAPSLARGWRWQAVFREFTKIFPETVIFTGVWPGYTPGFEYAFRVCRLRGTKTISFGAPGSDGARTVTVVSPLAMWDLFRFRPEVIFTNGFHVCTLYALIMKLFLHARVILLWQGLSAETGGNAGSLRLRVRRLLAPFFDLAATNTTEGLAYLQKLVGTPASKVLRFTGEVADSQTLHRTAQLPALEGMARPVFLFVGRPTRSKGVDKLLEAYSQLLQGVPRSSSLVIVGDGPEVQDLRQFARDLRIDRRVRWEGHVPYHELGAYYAACDVFVLPSLEDTWGVVAQEAMAFGKPVLCSCHAGSKEVIEDGINGFIFDPLRPEELAELMGRFVQEPGLIEKYGLASKEISKRHTPEIVAHRLALALAKALGS